MLFLFCYICTLLESGGCKEYCSANEEQDCVADHGSGLYHGAETCPESVSYPHHLDRESDRWQPVDERQMIIFSAFVDRRPEAGGPSVRIIAAGLQEDYNRIGAVYCLLWYETDAGIESVTRQASYVRIYPSTLHPDMWVSHFVLCPLQSDGDGSRTTPFAVSVTSKPCAVPTNLLSVGNRDRVTKSATFALCLPPIYNRFSDWRMVVEMIELHRILGVSELVVYNQSMSDEVSQVLRLYAEDRALRVTTVQWHFPGEKLKNNVNCQRAAINDCAYRMSSRHQFVAVTDLDEVIVPRNATTWLEMMAAMATNGRGVYMFQHVYFRRNATGEKPYLITQQSLWRTDRVVPGGKVRCKSVYNTDLLLSLDLHYHYDLVSGAEEYMVPPDTAMLHHYRSSPMSNFAANPERYTYIEDCYMHLYESELTQRYNDIVSRLGLE